MNPRSAACIDEPDESFSGAGRLFEAATRRLTRCLPKPVRALFLLAATIVFFPVIVGMIVLESVTEDLPGVRHLHGGDGERHAD